MFIREENIDLAYKTTISVKENIWVNVLTPNAITNVKIQIYYVKCYTNEKGNAYSAEIRFSMHNLIFIKYLPKVKMTKHFASKQIVTIKITVFPKPKIELLFFDEPNIFETF